MYSILYALADGSYKLQGASLGGSCLKSGFACAFGTALEVVTAAAAAAAAVASNNSFNMVSSPFWYLPGFPDCTYRIPYQV